MFSIPSRARRWPLVFTLALVGACADETTAPTLSAPLRPNAAAGDVYLVTTPYDNGAIGSLRWVLAQTTGGETIRFDPNLAGQKIQVDSAMRVLKTVAIEGHSGTGITIDGGGRAERLFMVDTTSTVTFRNVTITGFDSRNAFAIVVAGGAHVVLENSLFYGNKGWGGAVVGSNKVTLVNSTIADNVASTPTALLYGAAWGDTVTLINSTIANNGDVGAMAGLGPIVLHNSIITNHPRLNCYRNFGVPFVHQGTNISDDDTCGGASDVVIGDPKLAPLADNGGPTMTRALLPESPAINTGTACSMSVDQRYVPRDARCDVGAFEFTDFTTVSLTIDPNSLLKPTTGSVVVTGTISCSRPESFLLAVILTQEQKSGKTSTKVHAHSDVPVYCSPAARTFSASMTSDEGAFQNGSGVAEVRTLTEPWITPAVVTGTVKLLRGR